MGKILFTTYAEKTGAFLIEDNRLLAANMLPSNAEQIGAIYLGKVKSHTKNIKAYFVEISKDVICFMSEKDCTHPILLNRSYDGRLIEGDELLVQITKEAIKTKQPCVSAHLNLSNEYAVVTSGDEWIGISTKLPKEKRESLKALTDKIELPTVAIGHSNTVPIGGIFRTLCGESEPDVVIEAFQGLLAQMNALIQAAMYRTVYSCLKDAPQAFEHFFEKVVYDYEYDEIITDLPQMYEKLDAYRKEHLPRKKIRLYQDETLPLNKLYSIDTKMDMALGRRIWLKSGGYLIIEPTEALTVIDVNTGKFERFKKPDEAFEAVNIEAATEIAAQIRLRNLSGIIVIDFINMKSKDQDDHLMKHLRDLLKTDRMDARVVDMTPLGLVEITRKKEFKTIYEQMKESL